MCPIYFAVLYGISNTTAWIWSSNESDLRQTTPGNNVYLHHFTVHEHCLPRCCVLSFTIRHVRIMKHTVVSSNHFMHPQPMLQWRHYVFVLSDPCHRYFISFARIPNGFPWNLQEVIITTDRLYDYISDETAGTETREQDTAEYSNRRQSVLPRCRTGADA